MLKRLFSIILAITIATGYLDVGINVLVDEQMMLEDMIVSAEEFDTEDVVLEGQTEEGITYLYNDEKVVITGYVGTSSDLVIPKEIDGKPVTDIAEGAFRQNDTIKNVNITAEITLIPENCFIDSILETIILPETVIAIESMAFKRCRKLISIIFSSKIKTIGKQAFFSCSNLGSLTLPNTLTSIEDNAFSYCTSLVEIIIPDNVTLLRSGAFKNCINLKNVKLSNQINCIDYDIFKNCNSLTEFVIPDSVTQIYGSAFGNCINLMKITIPTTVTYIDDDCFEGCNSLMTIYSKADSYIQTFAEKNDYIFSCIGTEPNLIEDKQGIIYLISDNNTAIVYSYRGTKKSITIPKEINNVKITEIKPRAFEKNTIISDIIIESNLKAIPYNCFKESTLSSISLPESLEIIDSGAFHSCSKLKYISLPKNITTIKDSVFYNCSNLVELNIPYMVTEIADYLCYNCKSLEVITLPDSLTTINRYAFSQCTSLKKILLPEMLTNIEEHSFEHCSSLTEIIIPQGLENIDEYAFSNCDSLSKIIITGNISNIEGGSFANCNSLKSVVILDGVLSIDGSSFSNCISLESIIIPSSVTSISNDAFYGISNYFVIYGECGSVAEKYALENEFIFSEIGSKPNFKKTNDGLIFIENTNGLILHAFEGTSTNIIIPLEVDGIPVIGIHKNIFVKSNVTNILIEANITSITNSCFADTRTLKSIILPKNLVNIESNAFLGCDLLEKIELPDSLTYIGEGAFREIKIHPVEEGEEKDCYRNDFSIIIPAKITEIKDMTFCNSDLGEITFLGDIKSIGEAAFAQTKLKSITLPGSLENIGNGAFYYCKNLTEINIPSNVTNIGSRAFYGTSLKEIVFPDSVTSIQECALMNTPITKIKISSKIYDIPSSFASDCKFLNNVIIPESVHRIASNAFSGCTRMTNIYIPETTTIIDSSAFDNCYFLTITAPKDSYAITFAKENNIPYVEVTYGNDNESFESQIPSNVIDQSGNQNDEWSVITDKVTAVFDIGSVIEIQHRHGNKNVTFSYKVVETVGNDEQQSVVEDVLESGGKVVDFSLVDSDGEPIAFSSTENEGAVTITVPYTAPVSANKVTVYYIAPDGTRTDMNGTYDPSNKTVTFTTTHFSLFAIESNFVTERPENPDNIGVTFSGCTLSLNGNIGVNFYMKLSENVAQNSNSYMKFTLPNGNTKKVFVSDARINTTLTPEITYYVFSCDVASYEMSQDIKAQMFDGSGNRSKEFNYTVKEYAEYIIGTPTQYSEKDIEFAKALLNYGACSQKYFKKETSNLANNNMNPDEQIITNLTPDNLKGYMATPKTNLLGSFSGYSLVLRSETTLKVFFKPSENVDTNDLTFKVNGQTIRPSHFNEYYVLSVNNIKAWDLDTNHVFTVSDKSESLDFSCSALSYGYSVLNNASYPDTLIQLISALRVYQQKSEIYIQ